MKKLLLVVALVAAFFIAAAPANAGEPDPLEGVAETIDEVAGEVIEIPDQPDWAYEWRDREVIEVVCKTGEPGERIVQQSMWRPSEPSWDGTAWIVYDDWQEWAWPEAAQTIYKPLEAGDCPEDPPVPGETADPDVPVLAETGLDVWPLALAGGALVTIGALLMRARKTA